MIKWVFCHDEKNIESEVLSADEDTRIKEFISQTPNGVLLLQGGDTNVYINLANISWIVRRETSDQNGKDGTND